MYLSLPLLAVWAVVTLGSLAFALRQQRCQRRSVAMLRQTRRALERLENKNGRLWREVLKNRADGEYRAAEITLTNVGDA